VSGSTRRGFLATAGAGAAAVGIAAVAPAAQAKTPKAEKKTDMTVPADAEGSLVAYVADVHADTVTVMVGEREIAVHDRELVARLARVVF
jgi:hypothetical protein